MADAALNHQSLAELSAFVANARKEGFSFKPSQIVRDEAYCHELIEAILGSGSESLAESALKLVSRYHKLKPEAVGFD
ncbi:MAG: hypothetical protein Q8J65_09215 [Nitrosomonadales bacterium]|nr:hypothetical protein [Nitrosomonadales bacterium]